jgi:hypothetical protein
VSENFELAPPSKRPKEKRNFPRRDSRQFSFEVHEGEEEEDFLFFASHRPCTRSITPAIGRPSYAENDEQTQKSLSLTSKDFCAKTACHSPDDFP